MKTIAIMQPYFFPYIGYWQLINAVDRFVVYDDVNYIKGGWINRNRILINGAPSYITAPLQQASSYKRICDISLQPSSVWRDKLIRMLELSYRKAPYYVDVIPLLEELIRHDDENLADYLVYQLKTLAAFMNIGTEFVVTSRGYANDPLSGQERVLDICSREAAQIYCNLPGGRSLYDASRFTSQGITLKFIQPKQIEYKQFSNVYQPSLSIIDVLMFNQRSTVAKMLGHYELT